jgi:hypothetical protein
VNNSRTAERYEETKWKPKGSQQPHLRQLSSCHLPIHIHPDQQPQKNQLNHHEERNRDNHVNHAHKPAQTARLSSQEDQDLNKNIHMTLYNFAIVLPFNIITIFFFYSFSNPFITTRSFFPVMWRVRSSLWKLRPCKKRVYIQYPIKRLELHNDCQKECLLYGSTWEHETDEVYSHGKLYPWHRVPSRKQGITFNWCSKNSEAKINCCGTQQKGRGSDVRIPPGS